MLITSKSCELNRIHAGIAKLKSGYCTRAPYKLQYPAGTGSRFTGGVIRRVAVDVSGEPYVDLEREAAAMLARE